MAATLLLTSGTLFAADRTRNTTATELINDAAWTTTPAPTSSDRAVWNSASAGGATTLGGNASWQGIFISSGTPTSGPLFTNAANPSSYTLSLGSAGIDLNNGGNTNRGITFESNTKLNLAANQIWKLGLGASSAANIVVSSVISGTGSLEVTRNAASSNLLQLDGANTFSGGFTLNSGAIVTIGTAAVISASGTTSSALGSYNGTQFLTINGGRINSGNFAFHARDAKIGGDFTFATSARTEFGGSYDLQNGTRTMTLTRGVSAANTVIQGGNVAIRFSLDANSVTSFSNGTLRIAADAGIAAGNFVPVIAGAGTAFKDNAGLTLGSKVIYSAGTGSLNVASAVPSVTLEAGSYWNLAEGAAVRNPQVNSLAGAGTVLSAGTATAGTAYTLTIKGNSGTVSDFSGSVIDADTSTFATSTAGIVGVTKEGNTTQIFSGTNTYTGTTSVKAGTLVINGDQGNATGAVTVSSAATNSAAARLSGTGTVGGSSTFSADPDGAGAMVGGIHSPGNSVGKQTFDKTGAGTTDLTYSAGSIFEWELGATPKDSVTLGAVRGTDWDAVNVTGTVGGSDAIFRIVLNGEQTFSDSFWNSDRQWTDIFKTGDAGDNVDIASVFGTFQYYNYSGGTLAEIGNTNGSRLFTITGSTLTWSAVPEPSSALAGLLIVAGLLRRRRSA